MPLFVLMLGVFVVTNVLLGLRVVDTDRLLTTRYTEALRLSALAIDAQAAVARLRTAWLQGGGPTATPDAAVDARVAAAIEPLMAALAELRGLSAGAPFEPPLRRLDAEAGALNGRHDAADATPLADRLDAIDRETAELVAALRVHGDERAAAARDGGRRSRLTLLAIGAFTLVAGLAAAAMGWSTVNAQRSLVGQLGQLVHEDGLTRVTNRRGLDDRVPIEIARARRIGRPLSAVMIDLDYFKRYNDRRGHAAGDDLLREAAQIWRRQLRPSDVVARYGGEEFTLLLPACDGDQAVQLIDRLRPLMPQAQTFSAGVATWDGFESAPDLLARADRALLQAKRGGRNRTVVAPVEAQMTLPFKVA